LIARIALEWALELTGGTVDRVEFIQFCK
jgi:hypothetical protein